MMTVKLAFAFLLAFPFVAAAQTTRTVTRPHIVGLSHIALYCHDIDKSRAEAVGRGWQEPTNSTDPAQNRRVEVQWFTIE